MPLIVDLAARRMRWVDAKMPAHRGYHDISRHRGGLAHLGLDFTAHFGSGARMSMWELACLHAAARCPVVHVRRADGSVAFYRRGADEPTRIFFHRLVDLAAPDEIKEVEGVNAPLPTAPVWFALLRDDLDLPAGSEGYALRCDRLSATQVSRLAAADLVAALVIT